MKVHAPAEEKYFDLDLVNIATSVNVEEVEDDSTRLLVSEPLLSRHSRGALEAGGQPQGREEGVEGDLSAVAGLLVVEEAALQAR